VNGESAKAPAARPAGLFVGVRHYIDAARQSTKAENLSFKKSFKSRAPLPRLIPHEYDGPAVGESPFSSRGFVS
jgi:hypothetical protein